MSMEASELEEMATQMTPRAMARAELVASAILPAVSELVRTRARVAQCAAAQAWSGLLSERLPEERVPSQCPLASRLSHTHGAQSDCVPLSESIGEETQGLAPVRCLCRRK